MKHISLLIMGFIFVLSSCVDDYEDANPRPRLDAPASQLSANADSVKGGETITLSVSVIDAPGKIDSIGVSATDNLGTFDIDEASFNSARGNEKGTVSITYTAPFTYEGEIELTVSVFDAQVDEGGESARKSFSLNHTVFVEYLHAAPTFTTNLPESLHKGEVYDFEIDITDAPGGGIDTVIVFPGEGTIELSETSLLAIRGENTGKISGTYTAPDDYVGEVEISFTVVDVMQQRESVLSEVLEIVYEFDVPTIDIAGPDRILARMAGTFDVDIVAEGVIDTIIVQGFVRNTDEEVGVVEIDEASYDALLGESSGTFTFDFSEADYIGYIDVLVTVVDQQGAEVTESFLLLNEQNCEFEIDDFLGAFNANEPGYGDYGVNFTADPDVENRIVIDNFWNFSGTPYYDIDPDTKVITLPEQDIVMDGDTYTVEGSGMIDTCKGSFYVDYTVRDELGDLEDENTHTFSR